MATATRTEIFKWHSKGRGYNTDDEGYLKLSIS